MSSLRSRAWALFDEIVTTAPLRSVNPWFQRPEGLLFEPDYDTLELLLGVPVLLEATSQSGVPALALDVWTAHELRRAGFDPNAVWPREVAPRVLSPDIVRFINALPKGEGEKLLERVSVRGTGGTSSANILGKNYVKQVDVVMSSWATGPELMISTKRMDSSFGKNAANRVEESYGDAKNLRSRHPQAALGFLYGLGATALTSEPDTARWLLDLLDKLGREADAYDSVGLIIPELVSADPSEETDLAGPLEAGSDEAPIAEPEPAAETKSDIDALCPIRIVRDAVPACLDPGRFFARMCSLVLDRTPINFHRHARDLRGAAQ